MSNGFIYHLISANDVVYVGKTNSQNGVFKRADKHASEGKKFDSIKSYEVFSIDLAEQETDDIMRLSPRYNKIISSNARYIKKQSALDKIAEAIKERTAISRLNGCVYYDTETIEKIIKLITDKC